MASDNATPHEAFEMASPFTVFRKYQAILLAVFGVIIILLFAVGDQLMQMTQQRSVEDPLAVTYSGGKLKESQLRQMMHARSAAAGLLARLRFPAQYPQYPESIRSRLPLDTRGLILTNESALPEPTVRSMLLARRAEELGMRVSPEEVREYLRGTVALETVSLPQIREMIEGPQGNRTGYTVDQMLEPIRQEMLARQLYDFLARGLMPMPPAEQFAYYSRVYQKAEADIVAIPVDAFVNKVKDPSEKELLAYFDRHKEELPQFETIAGSPLPSPKPGFKLPHRAKVQYLKAKFDDFVERARPDVTDAEIAKYYEEHKEEFVKQELPLVGEDKDNPKEKTPPGTDPASQGTAAASQGTEAASQASEPEPPSATKSPTIPRSNGLLAQVDKEEAPASQGDAESGNEKATDAVDANTKAAAAGTSPPSTQASAQGTAMPEKPAPQYKPLSEVKDDIHKRLAEQKAMEKIEQIFRDIRSELQKNIEFRLQVAAHPGSKLPALADFNKLATKYNLTAHTTGLLSAREMMDEPDIGKSFDAESRQPYIALVFSNKGEHSLHQVLTTVDDDRNEYISWKTEDEDEIVPKLEGTVRDNVVTQWKRGQGMDDVANQAQGLALAAAKQMAEQLRKGEPIAEVAKAVPDATVVEADPFSWLTYGELRSRLEPPSGPPKLSQIDGVEDLGPEFMEQVFSLKEGDVAVAFNHPRTQVYVIQLKKQETAPSVLQQSFVADMTSQVNRMEVAQATQLEIGELGRRLFESIDEEFQLKWIIPPEELANR